jgi:hypothetical protein
VSKSKSKAVTWLKRVVIVLTLAMVAGAITFAYLLRRAPSWYARLDLTEEQRKEFARTAQNKLLDAREFAASARAEEARSATNPTAVRTPTTPRVVTFSQEEINALIDRWSGLNAWRSEYEKMVRDPAIIFHRDHVIIAGLVKDFGAVVSLHFDASVTPDGQLNMKLDRVLGGNLPMPESMYANYRDKLVTKLKEKLPGWQRGAQLDANGTANDDALAAGLGRLFLASLRGQPSDPYLFLPMQPLGEGSIPMKVTNFDVADGEISLTIVPLTATERRQLVDRLKTPDGVPQTVTARTE